MKKDRTVSHLISLSAIILIAGVFWGQLVTTPAGLY